MDQHEEALLNYLELAVISERKRQFSGRDKLLVLAGYEACLAAVLDIADRCRELILKHNPRHLVGKRERFHEMVTTSAGASLIKQLERQIPREQVELLVSENSEVLIKTPRPPFPEGEAFRAHANELLDQLS